MKIFKKLFQKPDREYKFLKIFKKLFQKPDREYKFSSKAEWTGRNKLTVYVGETIYPKDTITVSLDWKCGGLEIYPKKDCDLVIEVTKVSELEKRIIELEAELARMREKYEPNIWAESVKGLHED